MKLLLRSTVAVAIGLVLTGCATSTIFRADFDTDEIDALPDPSPPGAPDGDMIWSTAGGSTTMFSVVNDPVLGSRSARFVNAGPSVRYVGYLPVAASSGADRIYAYWTGVIGSANAPLDVWLGDTHFAPIGGLRFENGDVRVRTSSGYDTIGDYQSGMSHVVILTFDRVAGTFSVSFIQGSHSAARNDMPLLNASAGSTTRPSLYMAYLGSGSSSGQYTADEIVISEREPEM